MTLITSPTQIDDLLARLNRRGLREKVLLLTFICTYHQTPNTNGTKYHTKISRIRYKIPDHNSPWESGSVSSCADAVRRAGEATGTSGNGIGRPPGRRGPRPPWAPQARRPFFSSLYIHVMPREWYRVAFEHNGQWENRIRSRRSCLGRKMTITTYFWIQEPRYIFYILMICF